MWGVDFPFDSPLIYNYCLLWLSIWRSPEWFNSCSRRRRPLLYSWIGLLTHFSLWSKFCVPPPALLCTDLLSSILVIPTSYPTIWMRLFEPISPLHLLLYFFFYSFESLPPPDSFLLPSFVSSDLLFSPLNPLRFRSRGPRLDSPLSSSSSQWFPSPLSSSPSIMYFFRNGWDPHASDTRSTQWIWVKLKKKKSSLSPSYRLGVRYFRQNNNPYFNGEMNYSRPDTLFSFFNKNIQKTRRGNFGPFLPLHPPSSPPTKKEYTWVIYMRGSYPFIQSVFAHQVSPVRKSSPPVPDMEDVSTSRHPLFFSSHLFFMNGSVFPFCLNPPFCISCPDSDLLLHSFLLFSCGLPIFLSHPFLPFPY